MARKTIIANSYLCAGCHSCEVACKQINNLPAGVFRIKIEKIAPHYISNGMLKIKFNIVRCTHCEKPLCVNVCPTGALNKRGDGMVTMDKDLCNGCKKCIDACPIHAVWFNPETGKVEKCDLCFDKKLEEPFCVKHCMSKALRYSNPGYSLGIPW